MTRPSGSPAALIRRAGLVPDGPVAWGQRVPTSKPGIYVVALPAPLPVAPLSLTALTGWKAHVATITIDGAPARRGELAARLSTFWIPSATVLYIGQASSGVRGRVADFYKTPLGDARPHAGGHWIKTLSCLADCFVWSAETDDYDAAEREMLDDFARSVPAVERRALHDPGLVLPFANLRDGRRVRKIHGIGGATLP